MKRFINGFITAFSMYSILPMPKAEWTPDSMKYAFCFFPMIGAVIGGAVYGWTQLCLRFDLGALFYAGGMVLIPLAISGAIHMDGFIDTSDALYSRRDREKKLEILKDPHVGAFGVILCGGYMIAQLAVSSLYYQSASLMPLVSIGYLLSRTLSGLSVVTFDCAKSSGLVHTFASAADKKTVKWVMHLYMAAASGLMLFLQPVAGVILLSAGFLWFFAYKRMCYRQFGGLTGDLAGFFLQIFELIVLMMAAVAGRWV